MIYRENYFPYVCRPKQVICKGKSLAESDLLLLQMLILRFVCILFERWITFVAMRPKNCRPVIIVVFQWLQHDADVIEAFSPSFFFFSVIFLRSLLLNHQILTLQTYLSRVLCPPLFTWAHYLKVMVDWLTSAYDGTMYRFETSLLFRNGYN